jgi:hypothetical protein
MHTPMELLINLPSKHMGKTMIKKAINEYWYKKYNDEKSTNSHSSICFSIVESSLAILKNKFMQYLSSVTSIGFAPVNA